MKEEVSIKQRRLEISGISSQKKYKTEIVSLCYVPGKATKNKKKSERFILLSKYIQDLSKPHYGLAYAIIH